MHLDRSFFRASMIQIIAMLLILIFENFMHVQGQATQGQATTSFGTNLFKKKLATTCGPSRLEPGWNESSEITCAISCTKRYPKTCYSFMYNKITHLCTPGSVVSTSEQPPSSNEGDLYVTDSCEAFPEFSLLSYNATTAFAVHISVPYSFTQATLTCQCLDSHLFVTKTSEKFALFSNLTDLKCTWLGLDDNDVEGQFVWSDDHQEIDPVFMRTLFPSGQPDNARGEQNCAMGCGQLLDDDFCSIPYPFICEKSNSLCWG